MSKVLKPGENTGSDGGIFQEVGRKDNFAAIPDNHTVPPTTTSGNAWQQVKRTPDSKRK